MTQDHIEQSEHGFLELTKDSEGYPIYAAAYLTADAEYFFDLVKIHDGSLDWLLTRRGQYRKPAGEKATPFRGEQHLIDSVQRLNEVIQKYKQYALPTE